MRNGNVLDLPFLFPSHILDEASLVRGRETVAMGDLPLRITN
jgi:hypothetical protein